MRNFDVSVWKGKLFLECTGENVVSLLDQAVKEKILLEQITWVDEQKVRLSVNLRDFFRFLKCSRRSGVKMRIVKKMGFPFLWKKVKKRKAFFIGFLCFFIILFCLTSIIWRVEVQGTEKVPAREIEKVLESKGVYLGQFKYRLPETSMIQNEVLAHFPNLSWVGFRVEGTRVVLTVVEKKRAEIHKSEYPSYGPVHLVAKRNALITDVRAEQGNPIIKVNEMEKSGQILISGIYGASGAEDGSVVGARGKVMGEVWYESEITIPLKQKRKVFTGNREEESFLFVGGFVLRNPFGDHSSYKSYETVQNYHSLYIGKWRLPFGWVKEEYLESKEVVKKLSLFEAVTAGMDMARKFIKDNIGREGEIQEEKVLQRFIKNGKVNLKVHFDAIENIAVPKPILQGE